MTEEHQDQTDVPPPPTWESFPLEEFITSGLLHHINETILWKVGLALSVAVNPVTQQAEEFFVRQWVFADGHNESIENKDDALAKARHNALVAWLRQRMISMPGSERGPVAKLLENIEITA